ncbi:MAG TPA: hypothetical protein VK575_00760 [Gemmatimonadaceae bacterium]|nr:hypothetical protein [Gemmatimonadaceae bacterium]
MGTARLVIITGCLVTWATSAYGIECQSEKGRGSGWSWRTIDGKQCWYKGEAKIDKKKLQWTKGKRPGLLESYWPPLSGRKKK